jgi:hypothetical protein
MYKKKEGLVLVGVRRCPAAALLLHQHHVLAGNDGLVRMHARTDAKRMRWGVVYARS